MRLEADVVPGIHRIEDSFTNWYLIEDGGRLTVVDTGVPRSWESLHAVLPRLGRAASDIEAVVLTHAHFDHLGFAERARAVLHVPVYVHEADVPLTRHPWRYDHERARAYYFATQVRALPMVASFIRHRAWWPTPVGEVVRYDSGVLPVPGEPQIVFTPGHTHGHCALHLPSHDGIIAGDAVVTLDPVHRTSRTTDRRRRSDRRHAAQPGHAGCDRADRRGHGARRTWRTVAARRRGDRPAGPRRRGGMTKVSSGPTWLRGGR